MTVLWWGNRGEDRSYNSNDTELYGLRAVYRQRKCPYGHLLAGRGCINTSLNLAKGVTMIKGAINFSNDDEYYTPKSLVSRFGVFDYDPATTAEKAAEFGVKEFDTIKTNGLLKDWTGHTTRSE